MLKIGICEDEEFHQKILKELIYKQLDKDHVCIKIFSTGTDLIDAYKTGTRFDILFLDVVLNEENGIDVGEFIRGVDQEVVIVLATSMVEAAMDGYGIGVKEFLLKPIDESRFNKVLQKIIDGLKEDRNRKYMMEIRGEKVIIDLDEVRYIESSGRKLLVYTTGKIYEHYRNLSEDEAILTLSNFVKPHRSYLVNLDYIHRIKREEILLKDQTRIPLTVKNREQIYDRYASYLMEGC